MTVQKIYYRAIILCYVIEWKNNIALNRSTSSISCFTALPIVHERDHLFCFRDTLWIPLAGKKNVRGDARGRRRDDTGGLANQRSRDLSARARTMRERPWRRTQSLSDWQSLTQRSLSADGSFKFHNLQQSYRYRPRPRDGSLPSGQTRSISPISRSCEWQSAATE